MHPCQWLTKPDEFRRVRRDGKSYAHPLVVLITLSNGRGHCRFGVTTSRSLSKATERNRAKRRLRHAIRQFDDDKRLSMDYVLLARPPILTADWQDLVAAVSALIDRAETAAQETKL